MNHIYKCMHEVNSYQVDFKDKMKVSSIFQIMQDAAGEGASLLGVGKEVLMSNDIAWILSRIELKIYKHPKHKDKFQINTWPNKPMMMFHPRSFRMYDDDHNVVMEANTIWTLLDLNKRNIVTSDLHEFNFPTDLEVKPILPLPSKINVSSVVCDKEYEVKYSDLDCNLHVNNTKYIEWMFDMIPFVEIKDMEIESITTNYLKEIRLGDKVNLGYNKEGNVYTFAFKVNDEVCFSSKLVVKGE